MQEFCYDEFEQVQDPRVVTMTMDNYKYREEWSQ